MYSVLCAKIDQHNSQYPTALASAGSGVRYNRNYPARVKDPEKTTMIRIISSAARHIAAQINAGKKVVSNIIPTNRVKARGENAAKRQAPRHIAKGAFCGVFLGREAIQEDGQDYKFVTLDDGKILGAYPYKANHGHTRDFELLLDADLMPTEIMAQFGVSTAIQANFETCETDIYMQRKTPNSLGLKETLKKEISSKALAPGVAKTLTEAGTFEAGNQEKASEKNSDFLEKSFQKTEKGPAVESSFSLFLNGNPLLAFAKMLIESYLKKLAAAMGREYGSLEIEKAIRQAARLLAPLPPDKMSEEVDRYFLTIDHMHQWVSYWRERGIRKTLPNPSDWFNPDYQYGIEGAFRTYVKPWQERKEAWEKERASDLAASAGVNQEEIDKKLAESSATLNLAYRFKKAFLYLHPSDFRLKSADITKWEKSLKMLIKKDKRSFSEVEKVALWMFQSGTDRAVFWLREYGQGFGLRSVSGFRKHFETLREQMIQDNLSNHRRNENSGKNRTA